MLPRKLVPLAGALALSVFPQTSAVSVSDLSWIAGTWVGSSARATFEEHWMVPSGGAMLGMSRTVAKERMVAFEFLRIEKRDDGNIYYVAQPGGRPPTDFKLTHSTATSAVFENPKHDHPKTISYRLEGPDTLIAKIEGDETGKRKPVEFKFRRSAAK